MKFKKVAAWPLILPAILGLTPVLTWNTNAQIGSTSSAGAPGSPSLRPVPLVAPLFIEDEVRSSIVTIVNDDSRLPLAVRVSLMDAAGNTLTARTYKLEARGDKTVVLGDLLAAAHIPRPVFGSVSLDGERKSSMAAQLSIAPRNSPSAGNIEEEFVALRAGSPARFRAVSSSDRPYVAVRNAGKERRSFTLECLRRAGKPGGQQFPIAPGEMLLVDACAANGPAIAKNVAGLASPGGADREAGSSERGSIATAIAVSSSAPRSELAIFGFSAISAGSMIRMSGIPFVDVNELKSSELIFPGAAATASGGIRYELEATIANFGDSPRTAGILLADHGNIKTLQSVSVAPHAVFAAHVPDVSAMNSGSLILKMEGEPGELIGNLEAFSTQFASGMALPWKDKMQRANGGQHPWRTDGGVMSTLVLFNGDSMKAVDIPVVVSAGGSSSTRIVHIPALSSADVEVAEILTDKSSKIALSTADMTHGLVTWTNFASPRVYGMLVQHDLAGRMLRPFACTETSALCEVDLSSITVTAGGPPSTVYPSLGACGSEGDCNCYTSCGSSGTSYASYFSWQNDGNGVATLVSDPSSSYGSYQGIRAGRGFSGVTVGDNLGCYIYGSGNIYAAPSISSISPAEGVVGDQVQVTINGAGFDSSSAISTDSGVTGTIQSVTSTQIIATLTIPGDDAGGFTTVFVTAQGAQSNIGFFKQIPSNSSVISQRAIPAGLTYGRDGCLPGDYGIQIDVVYQVLDQRAQPIRSSKMRPKEKDLALTINGTGYGDQHPDWVDLMGGTSQITAGRTYTDAMGTFEDAPYGLCTSSSFTATYSQPISVTVNDGPTFYSIRTNHITQTGFVPNTGATRNDTGDINVHIP